MVMVLWFDKVGTYPHLHLCLFIFYVSFTSCIILFFLSLSFFLFPLQFLVSWVLVLCGYVWAKCWSACLALSSFKQRKSFVLLSLVFYLYSLVINSWLSRLVLAASFCYFVGGWKGRRSTVVLVPWSSGGNCFFTLKALFWPKIEM